MIPQQTYEWAGAGRSMQEPLLTAALILLIVAHGFLIRSCYALHSQIPRESDEVKTRLDGVSTLLDEALDMIHDNATALVGGNSQATPFEASGGSILSTLITNMLMPSDHGRKTQQDEWTVHEEPLNPTTTKEYQPHDGGATVPNR